MNNFVPLQQICKTRMKKQYTGLTEEQVLLNRQQYGVNLLTPPEKEPLWKKFLGKFSDPLIVILLVAGILSIGISFYEYYGLHQDASVFFEPVGIFIAILLATGLAFIFEVKADREFAILNQVNDDEPVQVIRDGHSQMVPKRDIVVDDIVILTTGSEIPADGELLEATQLQIDESTLTGEPICRKSTKEEEQDKDATFPTNHAMRGTKVMEGNGVMRVFAVGDHTENGKVFVAAQIDDSVKTPLNEQLERLGGLISKASYAIAALIVVGRIIVYLSQNADTLTPIIQHLTPFLAYLLQSIMIAVTLIVVAVPEGLPMAVTLSLAYSMRRMLKTNNLVRRMHACETMGAATVICTDKTGTLTQNQMRVAEIQYFNESQQPELPILAEAIALNSTAAIDPQGSVVGNPTEGALLLWLRDQGIDYQDLRNQVNIIDQQPFSTETKYMTTLVESQATPGKHILYIKGAPEIVARFCSMTEAEKHRFNELLVSYQQKAMRTLAFAKIPLQLTQGGGSITATGELQEGRASLMALCAISDPVRSDVPAAVRECLNAGIHVKIVTGDTPGTAREIGRQIGLWTDSDTDDAMITGTEFAALSDETLLERVQSLKIIARARPMDKKRLVEALQQKGEVVAVTGDGTNDAPALKAAHVGLSMGDGTAVAKEASDITIIDNSFASIGRAVMWGRSLYQNIQRFILFQMTVNVCACLVVLAGAFLGTQSPLTVTQMLWVNLIMDTFAAMALASLPPTERVMQDKPRSRQAFIISNPMWWSILITGGIFTALLLVVLWHLEKGGMPLYDLSLFFTTFVMLQFWNMFNARAFQTGQSALRLKGCKGFNFIAGCILIGQILIVTFGGQMFNVTPLSLRHWVMIICGTSVVLWIGEAVRLIINKKETQRH
ncbi:MAG: calcium-translocating P-type ATPase, PMCA-type [Prevotella sp.]|nr:calcium-translocating P-type ATPase, PMCA-type [Prevotella sp.]